MELAEAWFEPMELALRVRSDHSGVLAAAEDAFRGFGPARRSRGSPDLDILLRVRGDAPGGDDRSATLVHAMHGSRMRVRGGGSVMVVDGTGGRARGRLTPALAAAPAMLRLEYLELALQLMLSARGWLGVHGAAIVSGGRAVLLRARGGGGKTSLAHAAARRGLQVLAEDVVWIDRAGGSWWGLPWWLHPRPESVALFPELAGREPALQRGGAPRLAVALDSIRPGSATPRALPGPVVLVERLPGGEASRLTALALPEALALWQAGRAGTEGEAAASGDGARHELRVRDLLAGNAWRLDLGADLDAALDLIESLPARRSTETGPRSLP